ncbi:MAG: hypothetical protein RE471_00300 [Ferroplasma sp.]|uniref:DUF4870 domain-containing protein n=1 Tax=Ferroplasma sp. TaxID=2591003 RepID=UPI00281496D7|nr:hypothetical protein [Ferroplasma sp.]WMT51338.1 MAG: hypothetical protein RE471_00300 [Ferroplasma sp.]
MSDNNENSIMYVIAYLIPILTGIFVYITSDKNQRLRFHAVQAIILGIVMIVVDIIFYIIAILLLPLFPIFYLGDIIDVFIWIYGLYVGYKGSLGTDIRIPYIGDYAANMAGISKD